MDRNHPDCLYLLFNCDWSDEMNKVACTPKSVQKAQKRATRGERHVENTNLRALIKNASWDGVVRYEHGMHQRIPVRMSELR